MDFHNFLNQTTTKHMFSSFLPPSATATTSSTAASPSGHFLFNSKQIPTNKKHNNIRKISCNSAEDREPSPRSKLDRRNVLIGLGAGLYGATTLATSPFSFAAPISGPDVTKCGPADLPQGADPTNCLDEKKLGYVYQDVEIPWLNSRPTPRVSSVLRKLKKLGKANAAETQVLPVTLDRVVKVMVKRPRKKRSKKEKDELEEILVIEGIEIDTNVFAKFDVYINDDDDDVVTTEENTEFAGSFVNVPHKHKYGNKIKTRLRLSITDILEDLDAEDDDHVSVTLVPTRAGDSIKIHGIKIVLDV